MRSINISSVDFSTMLRIAHISQFSKSGLGATFDGLNKKRRKRFFQWAGMPQAIQFHPLWHDINGPMTIFSAITTFLAILERHYNGGDASKGHIASL
jgi:hypothetical protein